MAYIKRHSWQQQPGESPRAFQAFVIYRALDPKERSLQRVVSECNKSASLIGRWSSRWEWVERAAEWDDYQEMRRLEKLIEEKQKMDADHLRIVRAARSKAIAALTEVDPSQLARNLSELRTWITELIRLERLILGEPEPIEERHGKIQGEVSIEERLKQYAPVFQELLDEGIIQLEGQAALLAGEDQDEEGEDGEDEMLTYDELDDEQGPR